MSLIEVQWFWRVTPSEDILRLFMPATERGQDIMRFFPYEKGKPRATQEDAIRKIDAAFASGKTMVALQGPVGMGKTFCAHALAKAEIERGGSAYFISPQRAHQDQYNLDFPPPQTEMVKGRANYPCDHKDAKRWMTAANGVCRQRERGILPECVRGCGLKDTQTLKAASSLGLPSGDYFCRYFRQARLGLESPIAVFNFAGFLHQQRLGRFGHRTFMVLDECHNIESEILRFVELSLSEKTMNPIGIEIDREISSRDDLIQWMTQRRVRETVLERLGPAAFTDGGVAEGLSGEETDRLRTLLERLDGFRQRLDSTEWIVETVQGEATPGDPAADASRKIRCRPVSARPFVKSLLFSKADRILFMSGTILDFRLWSRTLGLHPDDVAYIEEPCTFPVENRPIYLDYAGDMSMKAFERTKPRFLAKIKEILDRYQGQKGIIHCHSFKLADVIREIGSPRFLFQKDFLNDKTKMLEEHDRRQDSVIVAPAMSEGVDLRDERSRFQVIAKIPWPSLGDKLIARRKELYAPYYQWLTAIKVCQSYGRSVRSSTDWAETHIVDAGFDNFMKHCGRLLPQWMKAAIQRGAPAKPVLV
jgi:Rad3-related DNA helicase